MGDIIPSGIKDFLNKDIDLERLKCKLSLVPDMVKTASEGSIRKVTNVRTLGDLLNQSRIYKEMLNVEISSCSCSHEKDAGSLCRQLDHKKLILPTFRLDALILLKAP